MDINLRAKEMAEIVRGRYNFQDKTVVDFGCGYGDMMKYALRKSARYVLGVDKKQSNVNTATRKCKVFGNKSAFYCADFENEGVFDNILDIASRGVDRRIDVAFCFSVLPYLDDPVRFVYRLQESFETVFVECQYIGDGPGNIADDNFGMNLWLVEREFDIVDNIGETSIEGRDKYRTIWQCYRQENRDE
jgi:SAM-dependent methyltransferase